MSRRGPIFFCYADTAGFSGQRAATELVLEGLSRRGWSFRRLPQPVLERNRRTRWAELRYLAGLLRSWILALRLLAARRGWLCVNLGQSRVGMLRDGVPILLARLGLGRERIVASLHGSVFMRWTDDGPESRLFRRVLRHCGAVTVLGEGQRERLVRLGLPRERVAVVVNSCDLEALAPAAAAAKHAERASGAPLCCLYLSSLIDTKGFPEYLEALGRLAGDSGPPLEAVLCGRLTASEFSGRFADLAAARAWIGERLAELSRGGRVRARWIEGAVGAEKAGLFREADLFVLPTRYAVEAQPLVLLEAMASACAIVTSRAGEIPTILDDACAVLLPEPTAETVAAALAGLAADGPRRRRLALAAHERFLARYQVERHLDAWEALLNRAAGPGPR